MRVNIKETAKKIYRISRRGMGGVKRIKVSIQKKGYENLSVRKKLAEEQLKKIVSQKGTGNYNVSLLSDEICCGCSACVAGCPKAAIQMETDKEGFFRPNVDEKKCISCGKCLKICPQIYIYAKNRRIKKQFVAAGNDVYRSYSTGGGVFLASASEWVETGGYICAPAFSDLYHLEHQIGNHVPLKKFGKFKYLQSDKKDSFIQIKELIKQGNKVMFCGTPCEVAGLKKYLGDGTDLLLTVSMNCSGIASPLVYRKYIDETYDVSHVKSVDFSSKRFYGSLAGNGVKVELADDGVQLTGETRDVYWKSLKYGMNVRKCCASCKYIYPHEVADITLSKVTSEIDTKIEVLDKEKALTLVSLNTVNACEFWETTKEKLQAVEYRKSQDYVRSRINMHENRDYFFDLIQKGTVKKAVNYALDGKYDVGVIGLWYGRNYGSMLTYYGLHHVLDSMGLSVLMIDNPLQGELEQKLDKTHPRRFAEKHYHISKVYSLDMLYKLNELCDTFIVGSDQLWNYYLSRPYRQMYYLDFADDNKKKIAYGTSFGGTGSFTGNEEEKLRVKSNLERFDFLSVRENFAKDICYNTFGLNADKVLDPVFLCDTQIYRNIEEEIVIPDKDYILAYILNPEKEKTIALSTIAKKHNCDLYVILDEPPWEFERNKKAMELPENTQIKVLEKVSVGEWLAYIDKASYVITDSFHGCCFSIILQKQFMAIINKKRGTKRFPDLMGNFGLLDYLVETPDELISKDALDNIISYKRIQRQIEEERKKSLSWLYDALYSQKQGISLMAYDLVQKHVN